MYSTVADIKMELTATALTELSDSGTDADVEAMVTDAINSADGEIDSYISAVATVPMEDTPRIINKLSRTITVYRLLLRKNSIDRDSIVRADYEDAVRLLKDIAAGKVSIGVKNSSIRMYAIGGDKMGI